MRASPLQAIRIATVNLAAARHFWESAFGFRFVAETEVHDPVLRRLWDTTDGGTVRVAWLDLPDHPCARLELYQWEGCTGEPIRDARRPWDTGVREVCLPSRAGLDNDRMRAQLERMQCRFLAADVFINPFGERCRLSTAASVSLTVQELESAEQFFNGFLGWDCEVRDEVTVAGAATIAPGSRLLFAPAGSNGYGKVEASLYRRLADPRETIATAPRMSPRYTGVWMLTASVARLPEDDPRIVDCDIPFVGRSRAIVGRAPGGVRFGVYEVPAS